MNNVFVFQIPGTTPLADLLNALVYFGRPVVESKAIPGGFQVSVIAQAQDIPAYQAYVRRFPVLGENTPAKETVKGTFPDW